jgi:hypothetical protein
MSNGRAFTSLGVSLEHLKQASIDRMMDAKILHEAGRHASAIAMGLYALEIRLKLKICYRLDISSLPKAFQIHEFDGLIVLSGLKRRMDHKINRNVKANWDYLCQFQTKHLDALRYGPDSLVTESQAKKVLECLNFAPHGVLLWLDSQALDQRSQGSAPYSGTLPQ